MPALGLGEKRAFTGAAENCRLDRALVTDAGRTSALPGLTRSSPRPCEFRALPKVNAEAPTEGQHRRSF